MRRGSPSIRGGRRFRQSLSPALQHSSSSVTGSDSIDDVARLDVIVGVLEELIAFGRGLARQLQALAQGSAIQLRHFGVQRLAGLLQHARKDAAQPFEILGMQVDVVDGGRQRGVMQGLQALAHIPDDLQNDVPRGGGAADCRGAHDLGMKSRAALHLILALGRGLKSEPAVLRDRTVRITLSLCAPFP